MNPYKVALLVRRRVWTLGTREKLADFPFGRVSYDVARLWIRQGLNRTPLKNGLSGTRGKHHLCIQYSVSRYFGAVVQAACVQIQVRMACLYQVRVGELKWHARARKIVGWPITSCEIVKGTQIGTQV